MAVLVALLRGVNVGGAGKLAMADLRAIATGLGYGDVATYIQSGNLVCSASASPATVAHQLEAAIHEATGLRPAVLVRTREQLAAVLEDDPFLRRGAPADQLHVVFCEASPAAALAGFDLAAYAPEEAVAVGDELHLLLPGGVGRSKLAADLARRAGGRATMRNLRTVTKLVAMAGAVDG
jgi:uncharacterized protein (DUF1697 family)